jgi:hypothetical protein
MRISFCGLLFVFLAGQQAAGAERLDELFASWEGAQREMRSLLVEFTLETTIPIFNQQVRFDGVFRFLRTPTGILASCEFQQTWPKPENEIRVTELLHRGTVYLLNHDKKTALAFPVAEKDRLGFLAEHFNPFAILLDRSLAREKAWLEVIGEDESSTDLAVRWKPAKRCDWYEPPSKVGRVTLMKKGSKTIPKNMPRQLSYPELNGAQYVYVIKTWRMNADDAPKPDEFTRPEDMPGWTVYPPKE